MLSLFRWGVCYWCWPESDGEIGSLLELNMQARLDAQQQYLEGLSQGFDDHAKQMLTILQQLQAPEPLRVSPSFLELVDSSLEKFPYVYFAVFFFFALCCFLFPFVILVSFVFYFHFSIGFACLKTRWKIIWLLSIYILLWGEA